LVKIYNVRGPDLMGETLSFIIFNYDENIKEVVGRTYSNLYSSTLSYEYDGKQITVNNDNPIKLEVGSYTDQITISIADKAG